MNHKIKLTHTYNWMDDGLKKIYIYIFIFIFFFFFNVKNIFYLPMQ